jgi:Carboxypeptidase regulatory-like domain
MLTVRNVDTGGRRTAITGSDGASRVFQLPTGHYEVRAEHTGFKTETQQGITLNISDNAVINFTLEVGATQQEVLVTAEAPQINSSNAARTARLLFARRVNAASQSSNYHLVKTVLLGGEGGWDYFTVDSPTHRILIPRGTHTMVLDPEGR